MQMSTGADRLGSVLGRAPVLGSDGGRIRSLQEFQSALTIGGEGARGDGHKDEDIDPAEYEHGHEHEQLQGEGLVRRNRTGGEDDGDHKVAAAEEEREQCHGEYEYDESAGLDGHGLPVAGYYGEWSSSVLSYSRPQTEAVAAHPVDARKAMGRNLARKKRRKAKKGRKKPGHSVTVLGRAGATAGIIVVQVGGLTPAETEKRIMAQIDFLQCAVCELEV